MQHFLLSPSGWNEYFKLVIPVKAEWCVLQALLDFVLRSYFPGQGLAPFSAIM